MKCGLLILHPLYQLLDPIEYRLIRDAGRHEMVMLDFSVKFDTLFTQGHPPKSYRREAADHLLSYDSGRALLFHRITAATWAWGPSGLCVSRG